MLECRSTKCWESRREPIIQYEALTDVRAADECVEQDQEYADVNWELRGADYKHHCMSTQIHSILAEICIPVPDLADPVSRGRLERPRREGQVGMVGAGLTDKSSTGVIGDK